MSRASARARSLGIRSRTKSGWWVLPSTACVPPKSVKTRSLFLWLNTSRLCVLMLTPLVRAKMDYGSHRREVKVTYVTPSSRIWCRVRRSISSTSGGNGTSGIPSRVLLRRGLPCVVPDAIHGTSISGTRVDRNCQNCCPTCRIESGTISFFAPIVSRPSPAESLYQL